MKFDRVQLINIINIRYFFIHQIGRVSVTNQYIINIIFWRQQQSKFHRTDIIPDFPLFEPFTFMFCKFRISRPRGLCATGWWYPYMRWNTSHRDIPWRVILQDLTEYTKQSSGVVGTCSWLDGEHHACNNNKQLLQGLAINFLLSILGIVYTALNWLTDQHDSDNRRFLGGLCCFRVVLCLFTYSLLFLCRTAKNQ